MSLSTQWAWWWQLGVRRGQWLGLVWEQPLREAATSLSDKANATQGTDIRD